MYYGEFENSQLQPGDKLNKNALTTAVGLTCLEIRMRNEEAINSTRNVIYSLKVSYFLRYRRRYFVFVSELI